MRTPNINSAYYAPGAVPRDSKSLQRFLQDEFKKIQNAVNAVALGHLDETHVSPAKPRTGDLRIADGTNWNPGSGSGMYFYQDSAWNFLTSASSGSSSLWISVKDHGAVGDGVTDDSTAINAAITAANALANGGVVVFPPAIYLIGTALALKSNVTLLMYGAKLKVKDSSNIHGIRIASAASNMAILGGEIDGNKTNNLTGGNGITSAPAASFAYLIIKDVYVHDFRDNGIYPQGTSTVSPSTNIKISGCTVDNNGASGISGDFIEHFLWTGNTARDNSEHGIGIIGTGRHGAIVGNYASGSGIADNFTGYSADNEHLSIIGNISNGGGNHGIHFGGNDVTISGNTVYGPTQYGIYVNTNGVTMMYNVSVTGNIVESASQSGIWVNHLDGFCVTGNSVKGCSGHGIFINTANLNGTVSGNSARGNAQNGIHCRNSDDILISGNSCGSNTGNGIELEGSTDITVTGNKCKYNAFPFVESGTSDSNIIIANDFVGNTSDNLTLVGASTKWERSNNNSGTNLLTSAATITLQKYTDYIVITGTTNITSITASWARRVVTLRFDDILTVTDGSNLRLAGNFVTTNNDTLTLVCDGTNWYEIARSVN